MRIVHVNSWFMPGMGYQENLLPHALSRLGHDVTVVASDRLPPYLRTAAGEGYEPGEFRDGEVRVVRLPSIFVDRRQKAYLRRLGATLSDLRPDVVHTYGLWTVPTLQVVSSRGGWTTIADEHMDNGIMSSGADAKVKLAVGRWVCRRLQRDRGAIIAVNPYARSFVTGSLRADPARTHLVPLGVNTDLFYPDARLRAEGRELLGLPEEACAFVTSGRLTPRKGFEELIDALALARRHAPHARLVLIGAGDAAYEASLRARVRGLGLDGAVSFVGWTPQDRLNLYYNASDVGVMPGKLGGIKEIIAVGRPLVVPDHLATAYFVAGGNGRVFAPGDAKALAEALEAYARDEPLRDEHGRRALEHARDELSWDAVARKCVRAYGGAG